MIIWNVKYATGSFNPIHIFLPRYWNTFLPLWLIECNIAALTNMIFVICSCTTLDINTNTMFRIPSDSRYFIDFYFYIPSTFILNIPPVCHFIQYNFDFAEDKLWCWPVRENKWRLWWCIAQCHNFFSKSCQNKNSSVWNFDTWRQKQNHVSLKSYYICW